MQVTILLLCDLGFSDIDTAIMPLRVFVFVHDSVGYTWPNNTFRLYL